MTFTDVHYDQLRQGCIDSANRIVPFLIEALKPSRVVDVGGGEGWWAEAFAARGVAALSIDPAVGSSSSLSAAISAVNGGRVEHIQGDFADVKVGSADLALCLEVGEHLPSGRATELVDWLTQLGPVVVFSAAIPGQGGYGHVNEQWPAYWAERFYKHGLVCSEVIRWEFWDDEMVEPWYRQNLLVFARHEVFDGLGWEFTKYPRSVVHPDIFSWKL